MKDLRECKMITCGRHPLCLFCFVLPRLMRCPFLKISLHFFDHWAPAPKRQKAQGLASESPVLKKVASILQYEYSCILEH